MATRRSTKAWIAHFAIFVCITYISVFLLEYVWRNSTLSVVEWIISYPMSFLINYGFTMLCLMLWILICRYWWIAFLLQNLIYQFLAVINFYKLTFKGDVFQFVDITLAPDAFAILENYKIALTKPMMISWICIFILTVVLSRTGWKIQKKQTFICVLIVIESLALYTKAIPDMLLKSGADATITLANRYYTINGYIGGLVKTIPQDMKKPQTYSKTVIENLLQSMPDENNLIGEKPNIIFIMNESFFDISSFPEIELSADLMPNIRELQKNYTVAGAITPVLGGGTCQVEYEILSAYPSANSSGYPYVDAIKSKFHSIVNVANKNGYYTMFMHPNTKMFYNRYKVCEYLDFKKTIFLEDIAQAIDYEGIYISDRQTYQLLIEDFENSERGNQPYFSYIVTMQNHGGYNYDYNKHGIKLVSTQESPEITQQIETFANLVRESDESLKYLLDYFQKIDSPTIIVFLGDHAPVLPAMGIPISDDNIIQGCTTPLLIWSNYNLPKQDITYMSTYKLGAYILNLAGLKDDSYFNYMAGPDILTKFRDWYWYDNRWYEKSDIPEKYLDNETKQWLLQYDRMYGKQYSLE